MPHDPAKFPISSQLPESTPRYLIRMSKSQSTINGIFVPNIVPYDANPMQHRNFGSAATINGYTFETRDAISPNAHIS
jgi:hypothetical protein